MSEETYFVDSLGKVPVIRRFRDGEAQGHVWTGPSWSANCCDRASCHTTADKQIPREEAALLFPRAFQN